MHRYWWIVVPLACAAAAIIVIVIATPLGGAAVKLTGGLSPVEVFASVVTPLGAIVAVVGLIMNGRAANRTLEHAISSERAQRFQKACELAASDNPVTRTGSFTLLSRLAVDAPKDYLAAVLATLDAVSITADSHLRTTPYFHAPPEPSTAILPPSSTSLIDILQAISFIQTNVPNWLEHARGAMLDNLIVVNRAFSNRWSSEEQTLQFVCLNKFVFGRSRFTKIDFSNARFDGIIVDLVEFIDTNLTGVQMTINGGDTEPLSPHIGLLTFENCKTEGLTINGLPYAEWLQLPKAEVVVPETPAKPVRKQTRARAGSPDSAAQPQTSP